MKCNLCGNDDPGRFFILNKRDAREYKSPYECKQCGSVDVKLERGA